MSVEDLSGGAPAPAETVVTETTQTSAPADTGLRSSIDKAFDAIEGLDDGQGSETTEKQATTTATAERNPDGTFKAKDAQQQAQTADTTVDKTKVAADPKEAPARFASDPEAKAAWAATPDPVKAAVTRTIRELEQGIEKHRGDATIYNNVFKPFVDLAINSNIDPRAALQGYVDIDTTLARDFGAGLKMIFDRHGSDPREWAQAILGQKAQPGAGGQQQPDQRDQVIMELANEVKQLRQGFGGISKTLQQQHAEGVGQSLTSFTAGLPEADRTLFQELDAEIAAIIASDPAISLSDAFNKAKGDAQGRYQRIFGTAPSNGAQTTTTAPAQTRTPGTGGSDPRKGQLSLTGAPGSGQNGVTKKVPTSPREALDNAFATFGL